MSHEKQQDLTDGERISLSEANQARLKVLMGEDYDGIEMRDYLSYVEPEHASVEIDAFEKKLLNGYPGKENIIAYFKGHIAYIYACGARGPFPANE